MNKVMLVGRLTKDPEVKNTSSQTAFCNFTIAVDRRFKDQSGQRQADFINCVAWRQTASFIGSYFHKGSRIGVVGSIQTRNYDDPASGQKRYVTEVVVDEAEFVESSPATAGRPQAQGYAPQASSAPSMPSSPAPSAAPAQYVSAPSSVPTSPAAPAEFAESAPVQQQSYSAPAQAPAEPAAPSAPVAPSNDIVSEAMGSDGNVDGNGMDLPFEL